MTRLLSRLALMALASASSVAALAAQQLIAIRAARLIDVDKGDVRRDQLPGARLELSDRSRWTGRLGTLRQIVRYPSEAVSSIQLPVQHTGAVCSQGERSRRVPAWRSYDCTPPRAHL